MGTDVYDCEYNIFLLLLYAATYLAAALRTTSSCCITEAVVSSTPVVASLTSHVKSAWASRDMELCLRLSSLCLNASKNCADTSSARSMTVCGTPASLATWVPWDDSAWPSMSLYKKTTCCQWIRSETYALVIVYVHLHVHVANIGVVLEVVGQGAIVGLMSAE